MTERPTFIVVDPDGNAEKCRGWNIACRTVMPRLVQAWARRQQWRGSCALTHKEVTKVDPWHHGHGVFEWTCLTNGKSGTFTIDKLEQPVCTP